MHTIEINDRPDLNDVYDFFCYGNIHSILYDVEDNPDGLGYVGNVRLYRDAEEYFELKLSTEDEAELLAYGKTGDDDSTEDGFPIKAGEMSSDIDAATTFEVEEDLIVIPDDPETEAFIDLNGLGDGSGVVIPEDPATDVDIFTSEQKIKGKAGHYVDLCEQKMRKWVDSRDCQDDLKRMNSDRHEMWSRNVNEVTSSCGRVSRCDVNASQDDKARSSSTRASSLEQSRFSSRQDSSTSTSNTDQGRRSAWQDSKVEAAAGQRHETRSTSVSTTEQERPFACQDSNTRVSFTELARPSSSHSFQSVDVAAARPNELRTQERSSVSQNFDVTTARRDKTRPYPVSFTDEDRTSVCQDSNLVSKTDFSFMEQGRSFARQETNVEAKQTDHIRVSSISSSSSHRDSNVKAKQRDEKSSSSDGPSSTGRSQPSFRPETADEDIDDIRPGMSEKMSSTMFKEFSEDGRTLYTCETLETWSSFRSDPHGIAGPEPNRKASFDDADRHDGFEDVKIKKSPTETRKLTQLLERSKDGLSTYSCERRETWKRVSVGGMVGMDSDRTNTVVPEERDFDEGGIVYAEALKGFGRGEKGDLTFGEGEVVRVIGRMGPNWYFGAVGKRTGKFPSGSLEWKTNTPTLAINFCRNI
ncbi:hypothetical protein HDU97_003439 [Phlyctochytrium planicorne]|nr:hypothetical protein HDU97_003439 [Phlyctochytrium planicorne]